jgi:hypothetical protein
MVGAAAGSRARRCDTTFYSRASKHGGTEPSRQSTRERARGTQPGMGGMWPTDALRWRGTTQACQWRHVAIRGSRGLGWVRDVGNCATTSGCVGRPGGPDVEARRSHAFGVRGRALERRGAARRDRGRVKSRLHLFDHWLLRKLKPNSKNFEYQSSRAIIGEYFSQRPAYVLINHLSMNGRWSCCFSWR